MMMEPPTGSAAVDGVMRELSANQASRIEHLSHGVVPEIFQSVVGRGRPVLMEIACEPDSILEQAVRNHVGDEGATSRLSVWNGADLSTKEGIRFALTRVSQERPRTVWFATPCGPFSPLQRTNARTAEQETELQKKRQHAQRIYVGASIVLRHALQLGCHVVWEWSEKCDAWRIPWVQKMIRDLGLYTAVTHGCTVGLRSTQDGQLMKKGWKLATSHVRLATYMQGLCGCDAGYRHGRCEGKDAAVSARYTTEYAQRATRVLCQELNHAQVIEECQGHTSLPVLFGLGSACSCEEPHLASRQQTCGHCVQSASLWSERERERERVVPREKKKKRRRKRIGARRL